MKLKLFFFLLIPFLGISQVQIGQTIIGEAKGDKSGFRTAVSENGKIVAIGAPFNDGNGSYSGHVRIYENVSGTWIQLGQDIDGELAGNQSGSSLSLSADGKIVAIGAYLNSGNGSKSGHIRIYQYNENSAIWMQIGQDIDGNSSGYEIGLNEFGFSSDGNFIAIGARQWNLSLPGEVRVFQNISNVWTQIGQTLIGENNDDQFGYAVALSNGGDILAISAPENNVNGQRSGSVKVYQYIAGMWTQLGQTIEGMKAEERIGTSLGLSSNGNILAIGEPHSFGNFSGSTPGQVRVFENISGVWTQLGGEIYGNGNIDSFGARISINNDGNKIAIGGFRNGGSQIGYVKLFENISGTWMQIGNVINGDEVNDFTGRGFSLSGDGKILVMGSSMNSQNNGKVRVYDVEGLASSNKFVLENFNIYPNPASDILNISLESNLVFEKAVIYSNLGQIVKEANQEVINVSMLAKGIYFVEVTTNQGKATKKVIIK